MRVDKKEEPAVSPDLQIDDILRDPKRFGLPTFEEFVKNPNKFRRTAEKIMETIFNSLPVARNCLAGQEYVVRRFDGKTNTTKSMEEVEKILKEEGLTIFDCKWAPNVVKIGGGKFKMVVEISPHVKNGIILGK